MGSTTMVKIGVDIDNGNFTASIDSMFGRIDLSDIDILNMAIYDAVHQLDFDGAVFDEVEGYAELTFKMEPTRNPSTDSIGKNYYLVSSFYHGLI